MRNINEERVIVRVLSDEKREKQTTTERLWSEKLDCRSEKKSQRLKIVSSERKVKTRVRKSGQHVGEKRKREEEVEGGRNVKG